MILISTETLKNLLDEYDRSKGDYRKNTVVGYLGYSDSKDVARLRKFYNSLVGKETVRDLDVVEVFQLARVIVKSNTTEGSESSKVFGSLRTAYSENWITGLKLLYDHHSQFNTFTLQNFQKFLHLVDTEGKDPAQIIKSYVAIQILIKSELTKEQILRIREDVEAHHEPVNLAKALSKLAENGFKYFTEDNIQQLLHSHDPNKTYGEILVAEMAPGYSYDPEDSGVRPFFSTIYRMNYSEIFSTNRRRADPAVQEQLQHQQEEKQSYPWF